ncbi:hypothetical protein TWF106_004178 [Orbilia oligospora]|uniref:Uncharacterized protein n=1 Tax=Orbilia oligospora TaxID=2813651 RepID=A0A7C8R0C4_ORBOL|nr:hypothetical protein TWF106_004178 [Orbilia oligospora]
MVSTLRKSIGNRLRLYRLAEGGVPQLASRRQRLRRLKHLRRVRKSTRSATALSIRSAATEIYRHKQAFYRRSLEEPQESDVDDGESSPAAAPNQFGYSNAATASSDEAFCLALERLVLDTTQDSHIRGGDLVTMNQPSVSDAMQDLLVGVLMNLSLTPTNSEDGNATVKPNKDGNRRMTIPDFINYVNGNQCTKRMFELHLTLRQLPPGNTWKKNFLAVMQDIQDYKIKSFPPNMGYLYRHSVMVHGRSLSIRERDKILKHIRLEDLELCWWETGPESADLLHRRLPAARHETDSSPETYSGFSFELDAIKVLRNGTVTRGFGVGMPPFVASRQSRS